MNAMPITEKMKNQKKAVNVTWKPSHERSQYVLSALESQKGPVFKEGIKKDIRLDKMSSSKIWGDFLFIKKNQRTNPAILQFSTLFHKIRLPELPSAKWQIIIFITLAVLATVPIYIVSWSENLKRDGDEYIGEIGKGISYWRAGYASAERNEFNKAKEHFEKAEDVFHGIDSSFSSEHPVLSFVANFSPIIPKRYEAFIGGVKSARLASEIGVAVTSLLSDVTKEGFEFSNEQVSQILSELDNVNDKGREIAKYFARIDRDVIPKDYIAPFDIIKSSMPELLKELALLNDALYLASSFMGFTDGPKTILLAFENNAELRGGGGFFGSYGLITVDKGKIAVRDMPGGGTYDFQGSFRETVISPKPLHLINPVWQFQDANWWPDWPASARKIIWFYEHGNGATVDGVIGMTPTFIERVLNIVGPIDLTNEYGIVVDKRNFYEITQRLSERKADETLKPKDIIGMLSVRLLEKLFALNAENYQKLISLLFDGISEKQFLIYSNRETDEDILKEIGWDAGIDDTASDYIMVAHSNIAGGKSDRDIKDRFNLVSKASLDGTVTNTLTITRTHHGREGTGFGGLRNVDYLRIYVPKGSRLVAAGGFNAPKEELFEKPPEGFYEDEDYITIERTVGRDAASGTDIMESFGKTVFANWMMVDPGESITVELTYVLPFKLKDGYNHQLFVQKQPGFIGGPFEYKFITGDGWYLEKTQLSDGESAEVTEIASKDISIDLTVYKESYAAL